MDECLDEVEDVAVARMCGIMETALMYLRLMMLKRLIKVGSKLPNRVRNSGCGLSCAD